MNNNQSIYYQPLKNQYNQIDAQQIQIVNYLSLKNTQVLGQPELANFIVQRDEKTNKKLVYINKEFLDYYINDSPELQTIKAQIEELFNEVDLIINQLEIIENDITDLQNDKIDKIDNPTDDKLVLQNQNNVYSLVPYLSPDDYYTKEEIDDNFYNKQFIDDNVIDPFNIFVYDQTQQNDIFTTDIGTLYSTKIDKINNATMTKYVIQNQNNVYSLIPFSDIFNSSDYYTSSAIDAMFSYYYTKTYIDNNFYDKVFIDDYIYNQQQQNDQFGLDIGTLYTQMATKVDKFNLSDSILYVYTVFNTTQGKLDIYATFYTKTDIDTLLLDYYTISQVNTILNSYYTKTQTDTLLDDKIDKIDNPTMNKLILQNENNVYTLVPYSDIFDSSDYYDKTYIDALDVTLSGQIASKVDHLVGANPATTYYYSSLNGVDSLQPYSGGGGITIPYLLMSGSDIIFNLQTAFSRVGNGQVQTTWANSTDIQHYANTHIIYTQAGTTNYQYTFNGNNLDISYGISGTVNLSYNPTLTSFKTILQVDNGASLRFFNTTTSNSATIMLIAGQLTFLYGSTQNFFFTNTQFQSQLPVLINNNTSLTFGTTGASRARLITTGASDYDLQTAVSSTFSSRYKYQHSGSSYGSLNHQFTGQLQITGEDIYFGTNGRIQSVADEINILYDIGSLSFSLIYHYVRSILTHYFYGTTVDFFSSSIQFYDTQLQIKKITSADRYISIPNYTWNSNQNSTLRITCADFTANTHQNFIKCNSISGDRNVEIMDRFQFNGSRISAIGTSALNVYLRGIDFPTYVQNGNVISEFIIGANNGSNIDPYFAFEALSNTSTKQVLSHCNIILQGTRGISSAAGNTFCSVGDLYADTIRSFSGGSIGVGNRVNISASSNTTYTMIWKSYVWNGVNWENQGSYNTAFSLDCSSGIGTTRINVKQSSKIIKTILNETISQLPLIKPVIWQYKNNTTMNFKKDDKIVGLCVEDIVDSNDKQVKQILGGQTLYGLIVLQQYVNQTINKTIQIQQLFNMFNMKIEDYRGQYIEIEQPDGNVFQYSQQGFQQDILLQEGTKLNIQSYALDPDKYCQYLYTLCYQQEQKIIELEKKNTQQDAQIAAQQSLINQIIGKIKILGITII